MMTVTALTAPPAHSADRAKIEAFLEITGFDVALESIRLSADSAPQMLSVDADAFGSEWQRLEGEVFKTRTMHDMALDLLERALSDDALNHAAAFYASDLGTRLVKVENASHMNDSPTKSETGAQIVAGLRADDSPRLQVLERLNSASGNEDQSIRAMQEVQVRFLMAAVGAGVIELPMDEEDLRAFLQTQEPEMRSNIKAASLRTAAYTYADFSDAELTAYAEALEHPTMQDVYALLNAVQFEIMANRFEAVAARLSGMQPSQDL
jgi:hypothetical protein